MENIFIHKKLSKVSFKVRSSFEIENYARYQNVLLIIKNSRYIKHFLYICKYEINFEIL